jgi:hypothetical protein
MLLVLLGGYSTGWLFYEMLDVLVKRGSKLVSEEVSTLDEGYATICFEYSKRFLFLEFGVKLLSVGPGPLFFHPG